MSQPDNVAPLKAPNIARSLRRVFIRDLGLSAQIGVYRHEHGKTQPIRVNIDLMVEENIHGDNLDNVVCYATVVERIRTIVEEGHTKLIETLAERIADDCMGDQRVLSVKVRVEKLAAILEASSVGIEIERSRIPG